VGTARAQLTLGARLKVGEESERLNFHRLNTESPNRLLARRDGQSQTDICEPARFFSREKAQKTQKHVEWERKVEC